MTAYFSRMDLDSHYLELARKTIDDKSVVKATVELKVPEEFSNIDENFIMQRFERMDKVKYETVLEKDYLVRVCGFDEDFVEKVYSTEWPEISFQEGNFVLSGSLSSIYLSFCSLRTLIVEHMNDNFLDKEMIMLDTIMAEGVRKLMVKMDMVRGSDFRFVEAGTANRYSYQWQVILFSTMTSDVKRNIAGTTNPLFGLMYGLPLYIPKSDRPVKPVIDFIKEGQEVDGSVYEMMHCYAHRGDTNTYLWSDLASDVINLGYEINLVV